MRIKFTIIAGLLTLVLGGLALAQQTQDGSHILHEFVMDPDLADREGGANPIRVAGQPPSLSMEKSRHELVLGAEGPLPDSRMASPYGDLNPFGNPSPLDKNTDRVDSLNYFANFDPSVIPFKRVVAQNQVRVLPDGRYEAYLEAGARSEVPVGVAFDEPVDEFWGTFMARTEPGRWIPLASVAPNQFIMDVNHEPDVPITLYVDLAGNYFLRTQYAGLLRVNLKIAVPESYFVGALTGATWEDVGRLNTKVAPEILSVVERVLPELGVDPSKQSPQEVIEKLVTHFREFEGREFPEELDTGDLYESICRAKVGVCRHRSLAFTVTAQALGFPTNYVYNEAHAFVEIFWPNLGWRRIDLGGAADELNAAGGDDREVHAPGDTLPQPEVFLAEQERMAQNGIGGQGGAAGANQGAVGADGEPQEGEANNGTGAPGAQGTNQATESAELPDPPPKDPRGKVRLRLMEAKGEVNRGGTLRVLGKLSDSGGQPISGGEVEIHLGPIGSTQGSARTLVATAVSSPEGWVLENIEVPQDFAIGRWSLFLVYGGDGEFLPAFAD